MRQCRLRMPDDTIRSVMVDEHQPVANLMVIICTKLGITNHDEYSLIATGKHTINGRRRERQDGRILDQKMEQLKKKLKTDEDLAWVDHSKTLDEQEIHEEDVVLLRRRFFYSDQNVDAREPLQLGLLYVQTRDAILSGTHPVTLEGACKFAGLQSQAQLGDFVEGKTTRPGYLNLKDYLPADYAKTKRVERKIFSEHKKYYGLSELEAKAKYVSEARSLPTYGVTFFLVKEKVPGKNKLVPRLLGVTRDCVMRVDADTKGILKTWPLTTVKRWAPSENSFTLDFGDYSDSYYSVQTSEGEQISQLIAGYIDIILRRQKAKDHFGIEGDEGATMIEDSVAPSRATIIQNQAAPAPAARPPSAAPSALDLSSVAGPTVQKLLREQGPHVEPAEFRAALEVKGRAEIGYESRPATQYVANYEPSYQQQDFKQRLEQAQDAVEDAQKVLDRQTGELDRSRWDERELEQKRRKLSAKFAEINAATSQLVSISAIPEEELNYTELNRAVETVAASLPSLAKDVHIVASLMDDELSGGRLVDAARRLCKATSDLLYAAVPAPTVPRQSLISAASRVGDATQALLYTINSMDIGDDNDHEHDNEHEHGHRQSADILLSLAKSVANSAAALVLKAKDVASSCQDKDLRDLVIGSATQCALATSQMVATAKIVAPTSADAQCKRQLLDACREVRRSIEGIQSACQRAVRDEAKLCEVHEAAQRVRDALDELQTHISTIRRTTTTTTTTTSAGHNQQQQRVTNNQQSTKTTTIIHKIIDEHSGRRLDSQEDLTNRSELVDQARNLARATTQLIQDIRPDEATLSRRHESRQQQPPQQHFDDHFHQNQSYIEREYAPVERRDQQHTSIKTITTTLYDEQQLEQEHDQRPLSMYEHEQERREYEQRNQYQNLESVRRVHEQVGGEHHHHHHQQQQQQQPQQDERQHEAAISGIVGDLETSIMFATAGQLRAQDDESAAAGYLYHRENVLRCAKALVEDTRPLVAGTANDQAQLVRAAEESVLTMGRLAAAVKASAASLGVHNAESQANLIRSVREVALSLADTINSTRAALGCVDSNDPRLAQVKDSAKSMVTSVTALLRTVKSVEEEQQRACRAIETTIEAIEQEIVNYNGQCGGGSGGQSVNIGPAPPGPGAGDRAWPEELARAARPVTLATAKTVSAASSGQQDDAIVAANMGRKAVADLLQTALAASQQAESRELRQRCQEAAHECAASYKRLVELLHKVFQQPAGAANQPDTRQELIQQSKEIASRVTELTNCSELLKGTHQRNQRQQFPLNVRSEDDPTVIAESELLGAASSIDAAAKKLENLKPRVTSVKLPHEELNFDEIILEAAKSIIEATAALLRAASASQRELMVDGRLDETETFYASDNNQWSEGLVSAARMVAAATHSLVEAANALVQGQASEERLISAAKQVASSTNQLLVACKVKADPDSRTMNRLSGAGNQVKRATDNLVRAAQQAIEHDEEQSLIISNRKVSGIAQEISAREQILKKEKELQVAKTQLMAIRKAKYAHRPDDYQGYGGSLD